jgi:hypothetical protein
MPISVAVVGAGAFGGWTALHLLRSGANVTLIDSWGPGNSRASSGGDTRVIRGIYGGNRRYVELTARSFALWWENEARWQRRLYHRTGALWMFPGDDGYARSTLPIMREIGLEVAELTPTDADARFPQIDFTGIRTAFYEIEAGYLLARQACETVRDGFVAEGGDYRQVGAEVGFQVPVLASSNCPMAPGSRLIDSSLPVDRGWASCSRMPWESGFHLRDRRFFSSELPRATTDSTMVFAPCGWSSAIAFCTGFPATSAAASKWLTTPAGL